MFLGDGKSLCLEGGGRGYTGIYINIQNLCIFMYVNYTTTFKKSTNGLRFLTLLLAVKDL